jgi:hypothetical protein
MKKISFLIFVFLFCSISIGKSNFKGPNFSYAIPPVSNALRVTCLIVNYKDTVPISFGSGVVVKQREKYYVVTARHVIQPILNDANKNFYIFASDVNTKQYQTRDPLKNSDIMWEDKNKDIAILFLSIENLQSYDSLHPEGTKVSPAFLPSKISLKDVRIGDPVYMLGLTTIPDIGLTIIVKQGIIAVIHKENTTNEFPILYVDNMPSNGMSGGMVFNQKGEGIGLITSYLQDVESKASADLTHVVPFETVFGLLERAVK